MLNQVVLIGRLTRDPELRYVADGTALCTFSIAISMKYKSKDGEKKEDVVFVNNIAAWGRLGEVCGEYLQKGSPVFVEGRLTLNEWEDKETKKKMSQLRITATAIQMLGRKGDGAKPPAEKPAATEEGAEGIPF